MNWTFFTLFLDWEKRFSKSHIHSCIGKKKIEKLMKNYAFHAGVQTQIEFFTFLRKPPATVETMLEFDVEFSPINTIFILMQHDINSDLWVFLKEEEETDFYWWKC